MIDLHTHSLFSDGVLLPSELVRRAEHAGYEAVAITDHVDMSNIDFVLPRLVTCCNSLNKYWKIKALPGVEITHAPLDEIEGLVNYSRLNGAKVIVGHGETVVEPVIVGTNRAFIEARVTILAHPGKITVEDAKLAKDNDVFLEITTRNGHSKGNKHVVNIGKKYNNRLVINNDAHEPKDFIGYDLQYNMLENLGLHDNEIDDIFRNSVKIING